MVARRFDLGDVNMADDEHVDQSYFELLAVLGTGHFGKVFQVRKVLGHNKGAVFAMKVLRKATIEQQQGKAVEHLMSERAILEAIRRLPFTVHLHYAFQTNNKLFLILDYISGGDLFTLMSIYGAFGEETARMYACELVVALESLHEIGIVHRDLKLENVMLDSAGHVVLTDFGLSKEICADPDDRVYSYVGTIDYMAPEIVNQQQDGYTKAVDWWSFGVLLWEMVSGLGPFSVDGPASDDAQAETARRIRTVDVPPPSTFSPPLRDLLMRLLVKNPTARLGFGPEDATAVREHAFFTGVDWTAVRERRLVPPIEPTLDDEFDTANFAEEFTLQTPAVSPDAVEPPRTTGYAKLFRGFSYVAPPVLFGSARLVAPSDAGVSETESAFFSKYRLAPEELGRGAQSVVRRCEELATGRSFAVKIVPRRAPMVERELSVLRMLRGVPGVVQLVDVCRDARHVYLVTELLAGGELFERIKRRSRFSEAEARAIFRQLLATVAELHARHVVHRDLKPENLLFADASDAALLCVVDFGFARVVAPGDHPLHTPCFSRGYGAPEQVAAAGGGGPGYDAGCDLWALGVILYTLLCGYPPFYSRRAKASVAEMEAQLGTKIAEFPAARWAGVSAAAMDLTRRLLQPRSSDRLSAADALQHPWITAGSDSAKTGDPVDADELPLRTPAVLRESTGPRRFFMAAPMPLTALTSAETSVAVAAAAAATTAGAAATAEPSAVPPPRLDLSASTLAKRRMLRSTASSADDVGGRVISSSGSLLPDPPTPLVTHDAWPLHE